MKKIEEIRWWHQVPLKDGRITPGLVPITKLEADYLFNKLDFRGRSVLDIGCWDGYFSFMAEQRGAKRVLALDDPDFRWGGMDGFNFLHEHFQSSVEWRKGTIFALPEERFDIILCYGVLYHLSDPLAAAINCFQQANEAVAFEGLLFKERKPLLKLLEPGCFGGDPSNTYSLSTGYLELVASLNGFKVTHSRHDGAERGAMLFTNQGKKMPGYAHTCFPVPPRPCAPNPRVP